MTVPDGQLVESRLYVTKDIICAYATITRDYNPIHLDAEFAASTEMGGIIAHGMLSLNLIWQSVSSTLGPGALRQATLDVRFVRPVREGAMVVASGILQPSTEIYSVWVKADGEVVIEGTLAVVRNGR